MQYIYLIKSGPFHKIGVANDVVARLANLQTGNPYPLILSGCYGFENAEIVEKVLHQKFSKTRERGEWFELSPQNISELHDLCILLGGEITVTTSVVSENDVEIAEEIQDFVLDDPDVRIEKRVANGEIRGFAIRQRKGGRKVISYIGKRANPEEFQKMLESIEEERK